VRGGPFVQITARVLACLAVSASGCDDCTAEAPREQTRHTSSASAGADSAASPDPELPGVRTVDAALVARLREALRERGADYRPRTHHLEEDGSPTFTNRLIRESSPHLLQHAHNPVNWFPWGEVPSSGPALEGKIAIGGRTTGYVRERGRCELPTSDPGLFAEQLRRVAPVLESGAPPPLPITGR